MRLQKTDFTVNLVRLNRLDFRKWMFRPGMRMDDLQMWWGSGLRKRRHNGLDLRFHETGKGQEAALAEGTRIPLIYPGRVVKIIPDFLAESVFVEAENKIHGNKKRLLTVYGHLITESGAAGRLMDEGSTIGRLGKIKGGPVPMHLHISIVFVPDEITADKLSWKILDETEGVEFLDPEGIL
ncbi:MAG: hypothetical protein M0018_05935 [Nitrospiraceae bacterium]|nr:hypothetical protein [Nitrospiraceae bacterium]